MKRRSTESFVFCDGDGSDDPREMLAVLQPILDHEADLHGIWDHYTHFRDSQPMNRVNYSHHHAGRYNQELTSNLYFWRNRAGNEVDVLAEHGEALLPIEIKSGQTVTRDYLIGLQKWLALAGAFASKPLLICAGDSRHTRSGIEIRPWRDMPTSLAPFTSSTADMPFLWNAEAKLKGPAFTFSFPKGTSDSQPWMGREHKGRDESSGGTG